MRLDLRQLRAFAAIVDAGSLGRAALQLGVTQPSLSRLMARLELRIEVPLFERHPTGMSLTAYGESLLPRARLLLAEAAQAEEDLASIRGLSKGFVKVGAVGGATRALLPAVIKRLLVKWPTLRVKLLEGSEELLAAALLGRAVDLVVAANIPSDQEVEKIADISSGDEWMVVASADHPMGRTRRPSLQAAVKQQWVMPGRESEPRPHQYRKKTPFYVLFARAENRGDAASTRGPHHQNTRASRRIRVQRSAANPSCRN